MLATPHFKLPLSFRWKFIPSYRRGTGIQTVLGHTVWDKRAPLETERIFSSPAQSRGSWRKLLRTEFSHAFNTSKNGASTAFLGNLSQCQFVYCEWSEKKIQTVSTTKAFRLFKCSFLYFNFCPLPPVTGNHWEGSASVFFTPFPNQTFINIEKIPLEPSFLQVKKLQLSQHLLYNTCSSPLTTTVVLHWNYDNTFVHLQFIWFAILQANRISACIQSLVSFTLISVRSFS